MPRPKRLAAEIAQERIQEVFEWEECTETSAQFLSAALAMDREFGGEDCGSEECSNDGFHSSQEYACSGDSDDTYESSFVSKSDAESSAEHSDYDSHSECASDSEVCDTDTEEVGADHSEEHNQDDTPVSPWTEMMGDPRSPRSDRAKRARISPQDLSGQMLCQWPDDDVHALESLGVWPGEDQTETEYPASPGQTAISMCLIRQADEEHVHVPYVTDCSADMSPQNVQSLGPE